MISKELKRLVLLWLVLVVVCIGAGWAIGELLYG